MSTELVLTDWAQADRDAFEAAYGSDGDCSCHISAPCGSCTHPGNPMQQEGDASCWVPSADGGTDSPDERRNLTVPKLLVPAEDVIVLIGEYNAWAGALHPDDRDEYLARFADLEKRAEKALKKAETSPAKRKTR